jgi:uncharacterized protein YkwD
VPKLELVVTLAIATALAGAGSIAAAPSSGARPQVDATLQALIIRDLNAFRRSHGLRPLRANPALEAAARQHTDEMASHGYFSHDSVDGRPFATRIALYYRRGHEAFSAGENLFWGTGDPTAGSVLAAWAGSAHHRATLLNAGWHEVGVAAVHVTAAGGAFGAGDVVIVTADLGSARS